MCRRLLVLAALVAAFVFLGPVVAALAHEWYSQRKDPVYKQSCCGGSDCARLMIEPGVLEGTAEGYRVRLSLEQSRRINPYSVFPIDALIPWERVQPSEDGNFHICIMSTRRDHPKDGVYCFFAPPNT